MAAMNPCPECGSTNVSISEWFEEYDGTSYYGVCGDCGYEAETHKPTYEEAVDHWNRRASQGFHDADDEFANDAEISDSSELADDDYPEEADFLDMRP